MCGPVAGMPANLFARAFFARQRGPFVIDRERYR